jgi:catechol 2,3-dioxygenase-like lactoylglutathione lyase family enzyme
VTRLSHAGICVSDLERSLRFYCEALGFRPAEVYEVGDEFGSLMELDGVRLRSQFIESEGGVRLELLYFASPPAEGARTRRPLNRFGLSHLSFHVDDVGAVAEKVRRYGGEVHERTRTTLGKSGAAPDFVYCSDPDGTRIELMKLA